MHVARLERRIEAHRREHPVDLLLAQAGVAHAVDDEALVKNAADAPPRVERRAGVLVDVLDRLPSCPRLLRRHPAHDAAVKPDLAGGLALDAEQRPPECRLPAAGFADEPEGFSRLKRKRYIGDGAHRRNGLAQKALGAAELDCDVARLKRGLDRAHAATSGAGSASRQLTRRSGPSATRCAGRRRQYSIA